MWSDVAASGRRRAVAAAVWLDYLGWDVDLEIREHAGLHAANQSAAGAIAGSGGGAAGDSGMSFLADKYAVYVLAAYGATALILGWLVWSSLAANAKARRDLEEIDRERGR